MNSFVINADLLIILEINKNIFKRTIEYFKNNCSPRDSLKEGRGRSGVGQASYS
jgi:hypothetical protein